MPRPRIIDDVKLTQLYKEGKSLKAIAIELKISAPGVLKRVRRLGLSRIPQSLEALTDKEKQFCLAVVSGQSRINAVMQTYDVTTRSSAKSLQIGKSN